MTKLNIPYRSQWDSNEAGKYDADCGPTCVAMVLNFKGVTITPNEIYNSIDFYTTKTEEEKKKRRGVTSVAELMKVLREKQAGTVENHQYGGKADALKGLKADVDAGNAAIALVKYAPWRATTKNQYDHGHFVVVTGYDDSNIYMNDPLFGLWVTPAEKGNHYALSHDLFCDGWGGFTGGENPNWVSFSTLAAAAPAPPPPPQPEPEPQPEPQPAPQPPTPEPTAETMTDINRRIRALAAYRWAKPPDFNDPSAVQLWLDNIGDWGLTFDRYQVQGGDTLVGLAGRFYGEQNRWMAIKAYSNLQRDGLWLGETLLIPHLGTTGAHKNPALPADNLPMPKAAVLDETAAQNQPALDYNAVAAQFAGVGFLE